MPSAQSMGYDRDRAIKHTIIILVDEWDPILDQRTDQTDERCIRSLASKHFQLRALGHS